MLLLQYEPKKKTKHEETPKKAANIALCCNIYIGSKTDQQTIAQRPNLAQ